MAATVHDMSSSLQSHNDQDSLDVGGTTAGGVLASMLAAQN